MQNATLITTVAANRPSGTLSEQGGDVEDLGGPGISRQADDSSVSVVVKDVSTCDSV